MSDCMKVNLLSYKLIFVAVILFGIGSCQEYSGIRVDSIGSAPIDNQPHIQLHYVKFKQDGLDHILLWRGNPKQETIISQNNYLKTINGRKVRFLKTRKQVHVLKNDYSIEGIKLTNLPYESDINFYKNEPAISNTYLVK